MSNVEMNIVMRSNGFYSNVWADAKEMSDCGCDRIVDESSLKSFFLNLFRR